METDFLKKEAEYRKENAQIELKTKELLRQVNSIVIKKVPEFQYTDLRKDAIKAEDLNLPKSVDEMGPRGMIHFYKTKIKSLQEGFQKAQHDLKQKTEDVRKMSKAHEALIEEKEKWFLQYNIEKNLNTKLDKQVAGYKTKLDLKETENVLLKKEVEELKNELKSAQNAVNSAENRLKCALTELEKQKTFIKTQRQEDKKVKESFMTNIKELTATVKQIQKHKNELLHGYKKQMLLVENLKKQKVYIESGKILEATEGEFQSLLEWKID